MTRTTLTLLLLLSTAAFAQRPKPKALGEPITGPTPHKVTMNWAWTQGTGGAGTGFNIYRKTGTAAYGKIGSLLGVTITSYADTESGTNPLVEGTQYKYVVTTTGAGGSESSPSNEITVTIPFLPKAPALSIQAVE